MVHDSRGAERRAYHRFEIPAGQLMAEVGAEGHSATLAQVQDISRGGVRLSLDDRLLSREEAGQCVVRFLDENLRVRPAAVRGRIRRSGADHGDFFIAVEFAEPLVELQLTS